MLLEVKCLKNTISIKENDIFNKVINKGTWYGGDFLSCFILPNGKQNNELGLAISKKVGKAFKRNKLKRYIRESYTLLESDLKMGFYIVFVWKAKANFYDVSFNGISNDLNKIFSKAGLLK